MQYSIITQLTNLFELHRNAEQAIQKSMYMKNKVSFFGIKQPLRVALQKPLFNSYPINTLDQLTDIIMQCWQQEKREYHYTATDLVLHYKNLWQPHIIDLIEFCIITHSWWDTVDDLAASGAGIVCKKFPELICVMDKWIESPNMWLRRSALLFQLKYKKDTDKEKLFIYCKKVMHEKEFFIRKAIGWVLREYSKTNPSAVYQFLMEHDNALAGLSKREASKYLK
ncbi:MAG TPA: DNA alkylation repair protein [Candidatus Babeliales bacterium]|jgi:3-methyladenine DNA glycosylase AlkD|nr:DNA alkylation repair protein [Candidatus Babeliales bacterium]